ncbi:MULTISPECIES: hypothetical protein [Ralstonia solanacearum species complex]|uniref:Pentapeptide repeat-containing protein n=2 Tax=Ralstonia solanacearum species complex TaxID=3116862 RepID=A0A0S4XF84_RALSL|nr:hypothetical protein [Ralstonia pseudosolanacearum]CUV25334.1 conserved protein of unknown function [Ralstonia solanacearum]CUV35477.1 conserved protein of unknown function [Ralstonia solanacearum]CUV42032.1 conserved protein of unknown function [Ralstonia solanacearum]CUV62456.1 conserved protein of unknown function [Ralstonia solanacearum]
MREKKIFDQIVWLGGGLVNVLGPKLEFNNCSVNSKADARGMVFSDVVMIGGVFDQKIRLEDFPFQKIHFSKVTFKGEYFGCDFGDWDDVNVSSVSDCDFSEARMHGCRFLNTEMAGIVMPPWPCFCLNDPSKARDFVMSKPWPKSMGLTLDIYTDTDPECVAIVADASVMADKDKISLDEVRALLKDIPGMRIKG